MDRPKAITIKHSQYKALLSSIERGLESIENFDPDYFYHDKAICELKEQFLLIKIFGRELK